MLEFVTQLRVNEHVLRLSRTTFLNESSIIPCPFFVEYLSASPINPEARVISGVNFDKSALSRAQINFFFPIKFFARVS